MNVIRLTALDDPRLDVYRDLRASNLTRMSGRFVVEGMLLTERLLASAWRTESVVCCEEFVETLAARMRPETPLYVVPRPLISELVGFNFHRGVLASGWRKPAVALREILNPARADATSTLVICPNVRDPENLGAILRSAAAFGCEAVLLGSTCPDPFSRRVTRTSMGAVFQVPLVESLQPEYDLRQLKEELGYEIVGAALDPTAVPLPAATRPPRLAIMFGNEAEGIDSDCLRFCDRLVTLPMAAGTDSLNVAVAAGVFLYHFCIVAKLKSRL